MNKIFLKKSFAGYPVWEYKLNEYTNVYMSTWAKDIWIHKDIVERFKDRFEERERPTSWEKLWELEWYWIDAGSRIYLEHSFSSKYKEHNCIFKTKKQAEASIALAQITQLLDKYDIPEKANDWFDLWWHHRNILPHNRQWLLRFDTKEKRDHFYKHHADLISKLAPFYIF